MISLQSLFSGCTVVGYQIGKKGDKHSPKSSANPYPITSLVSGDLVRIELKNGEIVKGEIKVINSNKYFIVKHLVPKETVDGDKEKERTIRWDDINSVHKLTIDTKWRSRGGAVGLIFDLSIIVFYVWAKGMSAIGNIS